MFVALCCVAETAGGAVEASRCERAMARASVQYACVSKGRVGPPQSFVNAVVTAEGIFLSAPHFLRPTTGVRCPGPDGKERTLIDLDHCAVQGAMGG